jgi:glycosyltransferase involved in cell wall biosynthesis
MKVIAMVPTRNEGWVIAHSLACLSAFCDVILVSDRNSDDDTREICRRFPKAVVLDPAPDSRIREQRWQLLDAARNYDGSNLLWASDADELLSPRLMNGLLDRQRDRLTPGSVIEARFYTLWNSATRYRDDLTYYRPYWKPMGFVDDRRADYDRSQSAPLHEPRIPAPEDAPVIQVDDLPTLHLQWMIPNRNQLKQAWYRCREWLDGGKRAAAINEFYAVTLPNAHARTTRVPREWIDDVTFPDATADLVPSWHLRDIFAWFDEYGVEHFEPLEIWHIGALRDEFRRRVGRRPRPDRSYMPPWPVRAQRFGRRLMNAARRRLPV